MPFSLGDKWTSTSRLGLTEAAGQWPATIEVNREHLGVVFFFWAKFRQLATKKKLTTTSTKDFIRHIS
jgi:hypothetical protein